jgi:hypothetical protein
MFVHIVSHMILKDYLSKILMLLQEPILILDIGSVQDINFVIFAKEQAIVGFDVVGVQ